MKLKGIGCNITIYLGQVKCFIIKVKKAGADFTCPYIAGIFIANADWASYQRKSDGTTYWRILKVNGELNKGRTKIRYYVKDYENVLFELK